MGLKAEPCEQSEQMPQKGKKEQEYREWINISEKQDQENKKKQEIEQPDLQ